MPKLQIALNITRTRVTILSFIFAIDLFALGITANLRPNEGPLDLYVLGCPDHAVFLIDDSRAMSSYRLPAPRSYREQQIMDVFNRGTSYVFL